MEKTSKKRSKKENKARVLSRTQLKGIPFDDSVPNAFRARLKASPIDTGLLYEFTMQPPTESAGHLTYDAVEEVAYDRLDELYPEEYYPRADIGELEVEGPSGEWFPVVRESCDHDIRKYKKENATFLILPDATYALSPEYRLYDKLCSEGIIDPDKTPFEFDKFVNIVEGLK